MKKFLLTLVAVVFAASTMMAQAPVTEKKKDAAHKCEKIEMKKHEKCDGHKDGQACNKPVDQQCPDCKAKAAAAQKHECKEGKQCDKPAGMKHECKEGKQCDKAAGMKHECKEGKKQCDKAAGMKHECKEGKKCDKAAGMKHECKEGKKQCDKAAGMKHECKEGEKCDKPADQQCPDCKEKAAAQKK